MSTEAGNAAGYFSSCNFVGFNFYAFLPPFAEQQLSPIAAFLQSQWESGKEGDMGREREEKELKGSEEKREKSHDDEKCEK